MSNISSKDINKKIQKLLSISKSFGATSADVLFGIATSSSVSCRLGNIESINRSEDSDIGLRVFVDKKTAIVSSSDYSDKSLEQIAERAVEMAKNVPEDPYTGIADKDELSTDIPDLDLYDDTEVNAEQMKDYALRTEEAALTVSGVTNSEGAEFGSNNGTVYYATSNGFLNSYSVSSFSLSASVIAEKDKVKETDYDFDSSIFLSDLESPKKIGTSAGERVVASLGAKKPFTGKAPVVFDKRVASSLLRSLAGAISGVSVARGTTLLKDKMGEQIFSSNINIIDDPFLKRGQRSNPFDAEGVSPQKREIIKDGILNGWFLDLRSARQLNLKTTGNAARGASSQPTPKPSNFYMKAGDLSVDDLISDIKQGMFVTSLLGMSVDIITGDYSRGAKGFWIENGKIAYPVSEATIAGNLKDMWLNCIPANDLKFKYGIDSPTLRVEGMTVAGN